MLAPLCRISEANLEKTASVRDVEGWLEDDRDSSASVISPRAEVSVSRWPVSESRRHNCNASAGRKRVDRKRSYPERSFSYESKSFLMTERQRFHSSCVISSRARCDLNAGVEAPSGLLLLAEGRAPAVLTAPAKCPTIVYHASLSHITPSRTRLLFLVCTR